MPELPEVETVKNGLKKIIQNGKILKIEQMRKNLRYPMPQKFTSRNIGEQIINVKRKAKYILVEMSNNETIIIHLGMSGSMGTEQKQTLSYHKHSRIKKHDHVIFHIQNKKKENIKIIYNDPRRFGSITQTKTKELNKHKLFQNIGIEPLSTKLNEKFLKEKFENTKASVKSVLLNQKIIAGLGNIYVCEALWRTGINPTRNANSIIDAKILKQLCQHIVNVLNEAIIAGGTSLKDHKNINGKPGYFQNQFCVYNREQKKCKKKKCKGKITRIKQIGRSTYFCPQCQK